MEINLQGKTALITGATGELGRVMARTLANCGADVAVHYHKNGARADELTREIRNMGRSATAVQADITDLDSVLQMKSEIYRTLGDPDIVINNAVVQYDWKSILEQDPEDYESQFKSCVMQSVLLAKAFIPPMIQKRAGRFIGINTECSLQCAPTQSAYVAGKRGMDGVLRVLAREIGEHQITVNQIAPGWTISEKERREGLSDSSEYLKSVPLKHRGTDQDIAHLAAFLASDLAGFISGAYIPVCGGNVMPAI